MVKLQLHPGSPISLYQQLKNEIRCAIVTNELSPGETLPSIRTLAESLGISPTVVARTYAELADEGLLTARSRSKTKVAERANMNALAFSEKDLAQQMSLLLLQAQRFGLDPQAFLRVAGEVAEKAIRASQAQMTIIECLDEQQGILAKELSDQLGIAVHSIPLSTFEQNPQQLAAEFNDNLAIITTPPHFKAVRDLLPVDAPPLISMSTTPDVPALLEIGAMQPDCKLGVITRNDRYGDVVLSYVQKIIGDARQIQFELLDNEANVADLVRNVDVAVVTPACKEKVANLSGGAVKIVEFTFHVDRSAVLMLQDLLPNSATVDR